MKSNKNKKLSRKRLKKTIFSVVVILIVLSFAASFFSSGIASRSASAAQAADAYPTPTMVSLPSDFATPTPTPSSDANVSNFLTAIKDMMIVSEDTTENATLIVGAINVYNTLNRDDMIIVNKTVDITAIEKLKNENIYFDDIAEDVEAEAWGMIVVDANGMATVGE